MRGLLCINGGVEFLREALLVEDASQCFSYSMLCERERVCVCVDVNVYVCLK